jgi:hypothetical protein
MAEETRRVSADLIGISCSNCLASWTAAICGGADAHDQHGERDQDEDQLDVLAVQFEGGGGEEDEL